MLKFIALQTGSRRTSSAFGKWISKLANDFGMLDCKHFKEELDRVEGVKNVRVNYIPNLRFYSTSIIYA